MEILREKIKKILEENPFAKLRRKRMRERLKSSKISFIVPSCIGGILFHDLGLQFFSPTINLMFFQDEFVRFVTHYDEYIEKEFEFYDDPDFDVPCAKLGDARIHFTHYKTPEEAVEIWNRRKERVNKDNIFVWCCEKDGMTREDIEALGRMNVKGLCVFTYNDYPDIPYTVTIPGHKEKYGKVYGMQDITNQLTRQRRYEKYFDFVKWFNEAEGTPYDVSKYSLVKKGR